MNHIPDELLTAFVAGDVDETLAVALAEHIDACPACLARSAALDPLAAAFAAVPDPPVPAGLAAAILARADAPTPLPVPAAPAPRPASRPAPWRELVGGTLMLGVAAALSVWADPDARAIATQPAHVLDGVVSWLAPVGALADAARAGLGTSWHGLLLAAGMAAWGLVATWRLATAPTGADPDALTESLR